MRPSTVNSFGYAAARREPRACANPRTSSASGPTRIGTKTWRPFLPEVFAKDTRPRASSASLTFKPAFAASANFPESGSRSKQTQSGLRGSAEREQAVLHVGFQLRKDHVVEPREIEFRVSLPGPEDLGRVGQTDRRFWILDFGFWILSAGFHDLPPGRMTSAGFLSSRRPRYTGWRSRWSAVHSWKEICATSRGSTQAAPFSRGGFLTGGVFMTRGRSFACKEFNVLWSNPVPTFPT